MNRWFSRLAVMASLAALTGGIVAQTKPEADAAQELGGADRALTYASTDKPLYRAGETVYMRAVVLRALDRAPLQGVAGMPFAEIRGPKGEVVTSFWGQLQDSVAGMSWKVPDGQSGGRYTLRLTWPRQGWAPAERTFEVRAYRAPRLKTQIVFLRDGYGPGDTVRATLHVERPEGGAPSGATVDVMARVDGDVVHQGKTVVDPSGNSSTSFALPAKLARGEGTLAMIVRDGGVVETATKTIPILLQTLDLVMYPEGGDLVVGLPSRVYVEARTPWGKPADVQAEVIDSMGRSVASFATEHEGRGRFDLVPSPGEAYTLRIVEPAGIERGFKLPAAKETGAVLSSKERAYEKGAAVTLDVGSAKGGTVLVTLSRREREVARQTVTLKAGEVRAVTLTPADTEDGVLMATAWGEAGEPLAERLVFRKPMKDLTISVEAGKESYAPGEEVELTVTARTADGKPADATVGLTVTDDSVLELIEKREQAPRLPAMVLLETDVRELADAHVYLDPQDERAPAATDLLLGTQGWRRFAYLNTASFIAAHGDLALRALAFARPQRPEITTRTAMAVPRGGMPIDMVEVERAEGAMEPEDDGALVEEFEQAPPAADPEPIEEPAQEILAADEPAMPEASEKTIANRDLDFDWRGDMAAGEAMPVAQPLLVMAFREYAHPLRPDRRPGVRTDFTETLYWNAGVRTGAEGKTTVRFALSDAVTGFRVHADGFGDDGALGWGTALVESTEPFHAEAKMPLFVSQGDVVKLPVALSNGTDTTLDAATVRVVAPAGVNASTVPPVALEAKGGARRVVDLEIGAVIGAFPLVVEAQAGPYSDSVTRTLTVEPRGFPVEVGFGGLIEPGGRVTRTVDVSAGVVPGSLVASLQVQPTPLASLTSAFERLIQEPYGCFEQTSSTTYPLVMAQQYFTTHEGVDPALIKRSSELLAKGYDRLTGFECKKAGYEWFGEDPGHEALTAYGLLEFTDMSSVHTVDPDMLARTRSWLLGRRDGKGGFSRERRALHTWIEDRDASNAYIAYALVATGGPEGLKNELLALEDAALGSANSYVHALAAGAIQLAGRPEGAKPLLERLAKAQGKDGGVDGATASIVGSSGDALRIETTALATMAWLRDPAFVEQVESAVRWLADACKGGRFGSTQSTVLALQAIVAYDKARAVAGKPGTLRLLVDGKEVGAVSFTADQKGAIALPEMAALLGPGRHEVTVTLEGGKPMPITGAVLWTDVSPASSDKSPVKLTTALANTEIEEGAITEIEVTVTNTTKAAVPTPIAIIGLPGGLEPRTDQLEELKKAGTIAAWETRGRDVVLYWRDLGAGKTVRLPVSLVAVIPGSYEGPASRAYLYYGDEHKSWVKGASVIITPKG